MASKRLFIIKGIAEIGSERRILEAFTHAHSSRQALKQIAEKLGKMYPHCSLFLGNCEAALAPGKEKGDGALFLSGFTRSRIARQQKTAAMRQLPLF